MGSGDQRAGPHVGAEPLLRPASHGLGWGWGAQVGKGPISAMAQFLKVRPSYGRRASEFPGQLVQMHIPQTCWVRISTGGVGQRRAEGNLNFKHALHVIFMFSFKLKDHWLSG